MFKSGVHLLDPSDVAMSIILGEGGRPLHYSLPLPVVRPLSRLTILQQRLPITTLALSASVQDIMLREEDQVVHHAHVAEQQLDRVARDAAPVALQRAVEDELRDAQRAAREVQQDLPDGPAGRAPVAEVGRHLRRVLDERDQQLDVPDRVHGVEPAPAGGRVGRRARPWRGRHHHHHHREHGRDAARPHAADEPAGPVAGRGREAPGGGHEVLRRGDDGQNERMRGEGDVVEGDGGRVAVVSGGVLLADEGAVVEC